jgi:AraC family transcriptional activator FtrA
VPLARGSGARLAAALDAVRQRLDEPWSVARLAREAATSPRGLHRRFHETTGMSPGDWLIAERLRRAQELLETRRLTVEAVAAAVGFGTAATLRHHFRVRLGTTPRSWGAESTRAAARSISAPP